jgi:hypothetical protein
MNCKLKNNLCFVFSCMLGWVSPRPVPMKT